MRAEFTLWCVFPEVVDSSVLFWVDRIDDLAFFLGRLAHDKEANGFIRVVDEGVRNASTRGEAHTVTFT